MSKKIALVFGGTRGIGAASVQKLAESGYDVAYTYVNSAPNVPPKIGSATTKGYRVDICEPAQVAQVFADVARDFGSMPHCVVPTRASTCRWDRWLLSIPKTSASLWK